MATLMSDTFDRVNSTTTVGSPQTGPAPTVLAGTCGILSNNLYASALSANGDAIVVWDLATPNVEITSARSGIVGSQGFVFCVASATDYIYAEASPGGVTLYRRTAGTAGSLPLVTANASASAGDPFTMSMKDGVFRASVNGKPIIRYPVQNYVANNRHGFRFLAANSPAFTYATVVDSAALPAMPETGNLRDITLLAAATAAKTSFLYRGRDTAAQDTAGVA